MARFAILWLTGGLMCGSTWAVDDAQVRYFNERVAPLLERRCFECHSHDADPADGGLMLDSRSGWAKGGDSGPAIVPGSPSESLLWKAVTYEDDELQMPPGGRLRPDEIGVLRKWIEDGAADPRKHTSSITPGEAPLGADEELWSLQPVAVPKQGGIDHWIDRKLQAAGAVANGPADKATLLRRASFGLTGLPPTPEQALEFIEDPRPDAWGRVVDRLLASPGYGERWGRHWLDLARYGDSNGADINYAHANAWRYRDYVIGAFNNDKPYDQFILEQLAGDLLAGDATPERRAELLTATGFLMMGPKMLAEVDGEKLLIDIVDEQLDVAGKTFLAMTFGCARCHDHKFDPITTRDYYAMAGIFRSTKVMNSLRPAVVVGEWVEKDVTPPSVQRQLEQLKREKQQLESELADLGVEVAPSGSAAARRAVVVDGLPTLRSTTWSARVRIDANQNLGAVMSAQYAGASQGHSLGFDRSKNGRTPRVVWNHARKTTILTAKKPIPLGEWRHLAVTYDAETKQLVLYVDGAPAASAAEVESTPFNTMGVGRREAPRQFQLIGDVDEVFVFDKALTQEEIVVLDAGQTLDGSPVFHWTFDALRGHSVIDAEGRHDGRMVGMGADTNIVTDGFDGSALSLRWGQTLGSTQLQRVNEIRRRMEVVQQKLPTPTRVMAVEVGAPVDLPVHVRGSHTNLLKDRTPRGTPEVFNQHLSPIRVAPQANGRLELANWIVDPQHPLTARVMVNRIWQHHFGVGLVATPSNFGMRGAAPTHPQLLDWLAGEFVRSGWSVKHIQRLIMMSDVYRRSSDARAETDIATSLYASFPIQRLEAEAIRDSLLSVSGELRRGSPGSLMSSPNMKRVAMTPTDPAYQSQHRGVYLPSIRVRGYEMFSIFDVPDNGQHVASRSQTLVAQQALFLMNNAFVRERVDRIADQVIARDDARARRLDWLCLLLLGRRASSSELDLLLHQWEVLSEAHSPRAAWRSIVHCLICSNEFIYIR